MGLDYTDGCVNFRDVGEYINLLMDQHVVKEKCLYRGGKVNHITGIHEIGDIRTIVNLRKGPDPKFAGVRHQHFPISNDYEKYDTTDKVVARWLSQIIQFVCQDACNLPVLFHCTSGKDRTGVVVAAILKILNIPDNIIIEEYLLSNGSVDKTWIQQSLVGIGDPAKYFRRVNNIHNVHAKFGSLYLPIIN